MKNCGRSNVRKQKYIRGSDKYITLEISLKLDSMDKMKITSSESKGKFENIRKGVDYLSGFQGQSEAAKIKKTWYAIRNISKKDLSKSIRNFEKVEKLPFEKKRPKHEPTDSYFYLATQLVKIMMRANTLNWHDYGGYTEIISPSLNVYSTDKDESKCIIVNETLSQNCSANKDK